MSNVQYYVLVKNIIADDKPEIDKVEVIARDTTLPFNGERVDIYLIDNKKKCEEYIRKLSKNIQKYFYIGRVGSEVQYTAFIDVLGFANYIKDNVTNDDQAEDLYDNFNEVVEYLENEEKEKFVVKNADFIQYITIQHSWVSDTFVIIVKYMGEIKENEENKIRGMMLFRLSMIVASIHHFMASKFELIVRGAISSKYSCITNNFILGEGVVEASKLEKKTAKNPRVIFEQEIISDEIYETMALKHRDNNLNFISKDIDGYYFVNYLAMLQFIPPMIGKVSLMNKSMNNDQIAIEQKTNLIEKYKDIVASGIKNPNEDIQSKYLWLHEYLGKVLLNDEFKNNIVKS